VAGIVTETVEAAWMTGPEQALVQVEIETEYITAVTAAYARNAPWSQTIYRVVEPDGVSLGIDGYLGGDLPNLGEGIIPEPLTDHFNPSDSSVIWTPSADDNVTISTQAGSFEGCARFGVVGGAGWGTFRWFCPGVGYVRDEQWSCYTNGANFQINELVRWTKADW
jgi:hypothetical protein